VTFRLAREFPRPDEASWIEYRHYNEKKLGKSRRADFPPFIGRLVDDLNAPEFVAWLSELTGIRGLVADPDLDGGGLHQTVPRAARGRREGGPDLARQAAARRLLACEI